MYLASHFNARLFLCVLTFATYLEYWRPSFPLVSFNEHSGRSGAMVTALCLPESTGIKLQLHFRDDMMYCSLSLVSFKAIVLTLSRYRVSFPSSRQTWNESPVYYFHTRVYIFTVCPSKILHQSWRGPHDVLFDLV